MPIVKDVNLHVEPCGTIARATFSHLFEGVWYLGALDFIRPRGMRAWRAVSPMAETRPGMHWAGTASPDMCAPVLTIVRRQLDQEHPAPVNRAQPRIKTTPSYLTRTPTVAFPAWVR